MNILVEIEGGGVVHILWGLASNHVDRDQTPQGAVKSGPTPLLNSNNQVSAKVRDY